ncbi:hypothetical protein [Klebsiella pneumoniae]|uniref:hypothetical protein n=1 Tax=Klebsiella pneumoniae TaxID=573 RepID=UPI003A8FCDB0
MNNTLSDSQLEAMIKSAVNSSGPLPPDEKFSQLVSALRELQERRKAAMDSEPVAEVYQAPNVGICAALGPSIRMLCPLELGTKLYRNAQPALVVPDEIKHRIGGLDWGWEGEFNRGWNACRAAMLQTKSLTGNSPVIPDGYVMVPVKPTREILDEFDSIIDYGAEDSEDAWRRLLAAAPQEVK